MDTPWIVICDEDAPYAAMLAEYVNTGERHAFKAQAEPHTDSALALLQKSGGGVLLVNEQLWTEEKSCRLSEKPAILVIRLCESAPSGQTQPVWVMKYQSAEKLLAQITAFYEAFTRSVAEDIPVSGSGTAAAAEKAPVRYDIQPESMGPGSRQHKTDRVAEPIRWGQKNTRLIAVYSPVGRCGKTSFAITLGEILAFHAHMLYINMEEYSGFSALLDMDGQGDITDLLYYARLEAPGRLTYRVSSLVRTFERLDYIPPAFNAGDLREIGAKEWCSFLSRIAGEEAYQGIILDVGSQVEEVYQVLAMCDRVYVPTLDEPSAKGKLMQFREGLAACGPAGLGDKIRYIALPSPGREEKLERLGFPERIVRGRMGDYVKKLVHSEEKKYLV